MYYYPNQIYLPRIPNIVFPSSPLLIPSLVRGIYCFLLRILPLEVGGMFLTDLKWPPQWLNFWSTGGAGGTTAGAVAPPVNMLEEALPPGKGIQLQGFLVNMR